MKWYYWLLLLAAILAFGIWLRWILFTIGFPMWLM
jgi:hypothetical protein